MGDPHADTNIQQTSYEHIFRTFTGPKDADASATTQRIVLESRKTESHKEQETPFTPILPQVFLGDTEQAHFRLGQLLGEGGLGVVHLASQTALSRHVAIKSSKASVNDKVLDTQLLQEARAMGLVEHPNVVPVHLIGQDESGRPVIVMKRIRGEPWSEWIDKAPNDGDPLEFHLRTFMDVCQAVAYSHSVGILHRDIKPENVMLGAFGEVYLLDWGLAVAMDDRLMHLPALESADGIAGTPSYMAPEMTVGKGSELSPQTDIFLLGATLFHVLTKRAPNEGETLFQTLHFSYSGAARTYPADFPAELRSVCERAMAPEPTERYASAEALRLDIQSFLKNRGSYALSHKANQNFERLRQLAGDEIQALFSEVRFGYLSALQIHPGNQTARDGLRKAVHWMVERELSEGQFAVARRLLTELNEPFPQLEARIEELERAYSDKQGKLDQIAFDYDENIGNRSRRVLMIILALVFAVCPFLLDGLKEREVPESLRWITDDFFLLASNAAGLLFVPVIVGAAIYTYRKLWMHKTSRIFLKSLVAMFIVGFGMRLVSLTGEVPLRYAAAFECAIYAIGLLVLGISVDRRFAIPSFVLLATALLLIVSAWPTAYVFCGGSVAACLSFAFDRQRTEHQNE